MLEQSPRTPLKEATRLSSYREKRAQTRHVSTSSSNTKDLEELQETLKTNMRRRGLSQTFLEIHAPLTAADPMARLQTAEDLAGNKLIQKYSNSNYRIAEVAEDEILLQPAGEPPTAKKDRPVPKTPLIKKNGSFLASSSNNQSQRNLLQAKNQPIKLNNITAVIQQRKTVVKGLKPPATINPIGGSKTDRKPEPKPDLKPEVKRGIGLAQHNKDLSRQLLRVEQLQEQLTRGMAAEKAAQLVFHFASIVELLKEDR